MTTEQPVPSIRGLQDRGSRGPNTPLRDFYGVLHGVRREERAATQNAAASVVAKLDFTEIEVIHSVEPYHFPTATIDIKESGQKTSAWGVFGQTMDEVIPAEEDLKDQYGKRMRLTWFDGYEPDGSIRKYHDLGFKDQNWKPQVDEQGNLLQAEESRPNVVIGAWEVMEVAGRVRGAENVSAPEQAKRLLHGATRAQFNKLATADPIIKADEAFRATILDGTFVSQMINTGQFTVGADEVIRRVEPVEATAAGTSTAEA